MYITITGELGSGKSTIAKFLADKYGFMIYSTGIMQREIAKEKGITTLELNKMMAEDLDNDYDKLIDNKTIEISETNKDRNVIFDSRMAWHFVKESFKVYLLVDNYTAASRVLMANRGSEEFYSNIEDAVEGLCNRKKIEDIRFYEMYSVVISNYDNYNLVLDSTDMKPEQLAELIYDMAKNNITGNNILLSPRRLFPTCSINDMDKSIIEAEDDNETLVDVVMYNNCLFILDGHERVCSYIQKEDNLVGVNMLKIDDNGIVEKYNKPVKSLIDVDKVYYKEWEEYNSMKFNMYPSNNI